MLDNLGSKFKKKERICIEERVSAGKMKTFFFLFLIDLPDCSKIIIMSIYLIIYACEDIKCINKYVYIYVYIYKQIGNYISVNIQINIIKIKHMNETLYISENNV